MKRNSIPSVLMLTAAAITALITYFKGYDLITMVIALFVVIIVFYFLGSVVELVLKRFEEANSKKDEEDGTVIEKDAPSEEGESETSK